MTKVSQSEIKLLFQDKPPFTSSMVNKGHGQSAIGLFEKKTNIRYYPIV